jgi:putative ABC transport system permease protein
MRGSDLIRLAQQSLRRHKRTYALSAVGIVAGIAAFTFFIALSGGVRAVVLGRIFPVDRIEIVAKSFDLGPLKLGGHGSALAAKLDDDAVKRLASVPGVLGAYPKQKLAFKAMGWAGGEVFGRNIRFEVFADGIDSGVLDSDDVAPGESFNANGLAAESEGPACDPKQEVPVTANAPSGEEVPGTCAEGTYCLADTKRCAPPIPVLVSSHLLEMYNGSAARAFRTPKLSEGTLLGLIGTLQFGRSFAGREKGKPVIQRRARVVGISDKAILFGTTMPLGYVRAYNRIYRGDDGADEYDSVVLRIASAERIAEVADIVEGASHGFELDARSRASLRAGLLITIMTLALSLITLAIVAIASIHVAHSFFMLVLERRREIGVLRAVGAASADVRMLILAESASVGLAAGLCGLVLARLAAMAFDSLAAKLLPAFPYRPDTYFHFPVWLNAGALAFAVVFCVLGAALPASRAAKVAPARALAGG